MGFAPTWRIRNTVEARLEQARQLLDLRTAKMCWAVSSRCPVGKLKKGLPRLRASISRGGVNATHAAAIAARSASVSAKSLCTVHSLMALQAVKVLILEKFLWALALKVPPRALVVASR